MSNIQQWNEPELSKIQLLNNEIVEANVNGKDLETGTKGYVFVGEQERKVSFINGMWQEEQSELTIPMNILRARDKVLERYKKEWKCPTHIKEGTLEVISTSGVWAAIIIVDKVEHDGGSGKTFVHIDEGNDEMTVGDLVKLGKWCERIAKRYGYTYE